MMCSVHLFGFVLNSLHVDVFLRRLKAQTGRRVKLPNPSTSPHGFSSSKNRRSSRSLPTILPPRSCPPSLERMKRLILKRWNSLIRNLSVSETGWAVVGASEASALGPVVAGHWCRRPGSEEGGRREKSALVLQRWEEKEVVVGAATERHRLWWHAW